VNACRKVISPPSEEIVTVKIQAVHDEIPETFEYGNVFGREEVGGVARLRAGLDEAQDSAVAALADVLRGPFQLLYVLHTTRTGAELGRYESPDLTAHAVQAFLRQFGRFLCEDSRHDLWLRSHDDDATIVLDRHNLIYAYGPLVAFEAVLKSLGVREAELPTVPNPHMHHYHEDWDHAEEEVLRHFDWHIKALRQADVQFDAGNQKKLK
jgi:hypothetical protein